MTAAVLRLDMQGAGFHSVPRADFHGSETSVASFGLGILESYNKIIENIIINRKNDCEITPQLQDVGTINYKLCMWVS